MPSATASSRPSMAPNALTRNAGLRLGPIFFETLFKHYLEQDADAVPLRKDELLYDQVFNIVRSFLSQASAKHTVEELQAFSNTRTPSTPANHVVRITIPMASCDSAAEHLISAFGGEENMKRTVGGVKWWQVRGVRGVNAEWMCSKKDQQEAKRRAKEATGGRKPTTGFSLFSGGSSMEADPSRDSAGNEVGDDVEDVYRAEMDNLKCILYFHGGGYYFGSIDQERYTMQRMARKIHGRLLAVNYRLAPQYPFPCAIQDILAAYLYLIDPPEGALHSAVSPEDIVITGDSAGGGLTIALLQVIRDAGLPLPAGGILVSPWCDLTHSFPSIYENTTTDVIPATGLSLHKPSTLWPPPPDGVNARVRDGLRASVRAAFHRRKHSDLGTGIPQQQQVPPPHSESMVELPPARSGGDQTVVVDTNNREGNKVEIHTQLQLYCPNGLVRHPLVSAALSYLGGLCPLLVITSDREVLRDEGIYSAHRAADPAKYPIKQEVLDAYPRFRDLTPENMIPTPVHLQVYDDAAHVLPVLFPFTTPAKYCFRAMATFCKQVYQTDPRQQPSPPDITILDEPVVASPKSEHAPRLPSQPPSPMTAVSSATAPSSEPSDDTLDKLERAKSLGAERAPGQPLRERMSRLSLSGSFASLRRRSRSPRPRRSSDAQDGKSPIISQFPSSPTTNGASTATPAQADQPLPPTLPLAAPSKEPSEDVAGPRHNRSGPHAPSEILAGDPAVYQSGWPSPPARNTMIRERVGTNGVIRPLEPASSLSAFSVPEERVGVVPEAALARYIDGKKHMDAKYSREIKRIEKKRARIAKDVPEASAAHLARLQHSLQRNRDKGKGSDSDEVGGALNAAVLGAHWSLAWALDSDEHPPPSSIVARRDTREARALALVADQAVVAEPSRLNANSLWSATLQLFTVDASKKSQERNREEQREKKAGSSGERRKKRESIVGHHAGAEPKSKRRTGLAFWRLRAGKEKHDSEARREQATVDGA